MSSVYYQKELGSLKRALTYFQSLISRNTAD